MFHNVINPNLLKYLKQRGFNEYREEKDGLEMISLYKVFGAIEKSSKP